MFTLGDWTHDNFRDVYVKVLRIEQQDKYTLLEIEWYNKNGMVCPIQGFIKPYPINRIETIIVKEDDYKFWRPYVF